ncbi:FAD:protein FMN transferase [Thalassomonas viridans]|uniref:FAD:protein FMN transferase n=1 Tax=Thalassomonas viridans TaxID=137584 RepID=A0AAE9Z3D5_9GAMM|nr:FAD:protein FMN transferase [Thalassomonas viridans]WDE04442.1 FAD:protein FMN transferase [Thalassomonas viridans]
MKTGQVLKQSRFIISRNWLLALTLAFLFSCSDNNQKSGKQEVLLQGNTMGTTYTVKLIGDEQDVENKQVHEKINALLKQVNQEMSTYIPNSELSLFNKSTSGEPVAISEGLERVMAEAIRLGKLTGGKLDVTVGPLVNLWGFGPEYRPETVPSDELLAETKAKTGLDKLTLAEHKLAKALPSLYVDLSTIAKGYGVDKVAELVEANGYQNYLVEIGGEMRLKGFKHNGSLWHVAIEKPITTERAVQQIIVPKDNAVATSGDYRIYFEADGQRFSHIIDPDTGKPINHKLVSVTVIHPSSMTADGLSTAMMVMGEKQAMTFAEENDLAALFIVKTEDGFEQQSTVKFVQFLK